MSKQRPRREVSPWTELGIALLVAASFFGVFLYLAWVVIPS